MTSAPHGTKTSTLEHDRVVPEWLARGRQPRRSNDITVIELIAEYLEHAQGYYRKNGKVTAEFHAIAGAAKLRNDRLWQVVQPDHVACRAGTCC